MKLTHLTIDPIFREFFDAQMEGKKGVARARIERCEASLRSNLEGEGERFLETPMLQLVRAEREFNSTNAFCRVARADDLLFALQHFVDEHLSPNPQDRRAELSLIESLIGSVLRRHLVDENGLSCVLIELRIGLNRGRESIGLKARPLT